MASITSWIRLEPKTRDADLLPATDARIHDPLWAIARQWQLGELDGDDAGSAIAVRSQLDVAKIDAMRASGDAPWMPLDPMRPIEIAVHASGLDEPEATPPLGERIRRGRLLLRALGDAGVADDVFQTRYRLAPVEQALMAAADLRLLVAMAGRVPDGDAAARELGPLLAVGDLPASFGLGGDTTAGSAACRSWLARATPTTKSSLPTWRDERLAHTFELRAGPFTLVAEHQRGEAVRWFDVDVRATSDVVPDTITTTSVPSRPRFRGMPSRRYWELEDGAVYWPSIDAGPGDVGRLLFVEFALSLADDWLVVPVDLPTNTLACVTSVVAIDTFGKEIVIRPAAQLDGEPAPWRFCETSGATPERPLLAVFAEAPGVLAGPAVDAADLVRDEVSNAYWGVERTRCGADGQPRDVVLDAPADVATGYRVGPIIGEAFHPYLDRLDDGSPILVRATVPDRPLALAHPILPAHLDGATAPIRPLRLQRRMVLLRASDGTYHAIRARAVQSTPTAPPAPVLTFDRVRTTSD
jgi:hypothetical protein